MTIFKRLLLLATGLTVSFSIHSANYYFYEGEQISPAASKFIEDAVQINDSFLSSRFPYEEIKYSLQVPTNMSYSNGEFQKFEGTYLTQAATPVTEEYYNDVVYAGDSLAYGLGLAQAYLGKYDVVSWGGLGVYDFADYKKDPVYNQSEEKKTCLEWIEELQPKVLYLQLGTNGIYIFSNQEHLNKYNKLLDRIALACPNTRIVLVSVLPWGQSWEGENFNNQKIDHFNMYLLELAYERGYYFLNAAEAFKDESGCFSKKLSSTDGIHWNTNGKIEFMKYFTTHPVPSK